MRSLPFCLFLLGPLFALPVTAHDGEDHGVTAEIVGQTLEPRFEAQGSLAEVTGILNAGQLWIFASHIATAAPWPGLRVELESGGQSLQAVEQASGVYRVPASQLSLPGRHAVTLTLQGEAVEELLTGEITSPAPASSPRQAYGWIAAAGLLVVAAGVLGFRRRSRR
jgi:hypothetical protein